MNDTGNPKESSGDSFQGGDEAPRHPPKTEPNLPFTRYVRALRDRSEGLDRYAEEMMEHLRQILTHEMRSRSLWSSPPPYVGIYGHTSWTLPSDGTTLGPLDEFLHDCYTALFGKGQLARLVLHLEVKPDIEGLVRLYLKNFLGKRQKDHDPLGYHLFEVVCSAVRAAVDAGELHVLGGPLRIRNATIVGISPECSVDRVASAEDLRDLAVVWNNGLMPGLVTAERHERRQVTERLRAHLFDIEAEGIEAFRFKDLIDAIKHDVRARMANAYEGSTGEKLPQGDGSGELVRIFMPKHRLDDLDGFHKLIQCVANLIPKVDRQRRTRKHLERLWTYLRRFAEYSDDEHLPSQRHLGETLKISRDRLPDLLKTLGGLVRQCQARLAGTVVHLGDRRRGGHHG